MILTVDNVEYDVLVPAGGVKRSFDILDGKNAGRLTSGRMTRDITGTFYNYKLQDVYKRQKLRLANRHLRLME